MLCCHRQSRTTSPTLSVKSGNHGHGGARQIPWPALYSYLFCGAIGLPNTAGQLVVPTCLIIIKSISGFRALTNVAQQFYKTGLAKSDVRIGKGKGRYHRALLCRMRMSGIALAHPTISVNAAGCVEYRFPAHLEILMRTIRIDPAVDVIQDRVDRLLMPGAHLTAGES